jgi:hypothetical protein
VYSVPSVYSVVFAKHLTTEHRIEHEECDPIPCMRSEVAALQSHNHGIHGMHGMHGKKRRRMSVKEETRYRAIKENGAANFLHRRLSPYTCHRNQRASRGSLV